MFSNSRVVEIEWGACDPAGIVFNPRYFEYFDWSTALLFQRALGMTKAEMLAAYDCKGIPLVDTRARFIAPSKYGDVVRIDSSIVEFRRASFDVRHRLMRGDTLAVEGLETRVWVGAHPDDPARLKAKPIPDAVLERFGRAG
ncbi:MAG TPA: thioesterase family protein [Stellaceae bacterium]|nr:thioesterase family protein [Stellaceae bacterium]